MRGLGERFRTREFLVTQDNYSNVSFSFLSVFSSFLLPHCQFSNALVIAAFLVVLFVFPFTIHKEFQASIITLSLEMRKQSQRSKEKLLIKFLNPFLDKSRMRKSVQSIGFCDFSEP